MLATRPENSHIYKKEVILEPQETTFHPGLMIIGKSNLSNYLNVPRNVETTRTRVMKTTLRKLIQASILHKRNG